MWVARGLDPPPSLGSPPRSQRASWYGTSLTNLTDTLIIRVLESARVSHLSTREHFRRIAEATERDLEEDLAKLTVAEASRISEQILALASHLPTSSLEPETAEFVSLSELIRRRQETRATGTPRSASEGRRGPG